MKLNIRVRALVIDVWSSTDSIRNAVNASYATSKMILRTSRICRHGENILKPRQLHSAKTRKLDLTTLFSQPTWSVATLIPQSTTRDGPERIDSKHLHHLLRLSALPPPKDVHEEKAMLATLSSQLHFVREIQKVDTDNIEPLSSLRDETMEGRKDAELGLEALTEALAEEEERGKHYRRVRRRPSSDGKEAGEEKKCDVLGAAEKKVGRYFVVEGGKGK